MPETLPSRTCNRKYKISNGFLQVRKIQYLTSLKNGRQLQCLALHISKASFHRFCLCKKDGKTSLELDVWIANRLSKTALPWVFSVSKGMVILLLLQDGYYRQVTETNILLLSHTVRTILSFIQRNLDVLVLSKSTLVTLYLQFLVLYINTNINNGMKASLQKSHCLYLRMFVQIICCFIASRAYRAGHNFYSNSAQSRMN